MQGPTQAVVTSAMHQEVPAHIVCRQGEIDGPRREAHLRLGRDLLGCRATACVAHGHGVAFRLRKADLMDVARFVENETRCCTFMTITLRLDAASEDLWLEFDGPDGTRAVLFAELAMNGVAGEASTVAA